MKDQDVFKEIGLNMNEGKIYAALVKHGKLSASDVSSKAEVPYGKVYVVLQSLVDKGLVQVVPEKTKKFAPASPENLEKMIDKKKKILDEAKNKVKELRQFYDDKSRDALVIAEGDRGFWKIADEMRDVDKYLYTIRWDSKVRPGSISHWKKWRKQHQHVKTGDLVRYDKETEKNVKKWHKVEENMKAFDNEGVAMSIIDDDEVMIGLIKKNTTLLIRDQAFAKIMKKMFLAAYRDAKAIE